MTRSWIFKSPSCSFKAGFLSGKTLSLAFSRINCCFSHPSLCFCKIAIRLEGQAKRDYLHRQQLLLAMAVLNLGISSDSKQTRGYLMKWTTAVKWTTLIANYPLRSSWAFASETLLHFLLCTRLLSDSSNSFIFGSHWVSLVALFWPCYNPKTFQNCFGN